MPAEEVERWTAGSPGRDHHTESDTKRPTEGSFACSPRPTFVVSLTISVPSTMSNRHTAVAVVGMNELGVSCAVAEWRTVARSSTVLATAPLRQAGGGNVYFAALIRACAFTESLCLSDVAGCESRRPDQFRFVCAGCGFRGHSVTSSDKDGSYTEHRFVYMAG